MKSKKATAKRIVTMLLAMMLLLAVSATSVNAAAIAAPGKTSITYAKAINTSQVTIKWKKLSKNTAGYAVYRNNKRVKLIKSKNTVSFNDTKLKAGTRYTYSVRAYRTYKQKQWYNKKAKKWQVKKPAKKHRGKSRYVTKYVYGKYSDKKAVTTKTLAKKLQNASNLKIADIRNEMLKMVNEERTKEGLPALKLYGGVNDTAQEKAIDMANNKKLDHYSEELGYPNQQYYNHNIKVTDWGENIAQGQVSISDAMKSWMNSPGHRANILDGNFTHIGIGYYKGYWVQQFATNPEEEIHKFPSSIVTCPTCGANRAECDFYWHYDGTDYEGNTVTIYVCRSCGGFINMCPKCNGVMKDAGVDTENGCATTKCRKCGHGISKSSVEKCSACGKSMSNHLDYDRFKIRISYKAYGKTIYASMQYCPDKNKYVFTTDSSRAKYAEALSELRSRLKEGEDAFDYISWSLDGTNIETPRIETLEEFYGTDRY